MTNLRLRDKIESRLNNEAIIIACDKTQDVANKEKAIFFNYDAKKVSTVKSLEKRNYDADEKCWRTKMDLNSIKETLNYQLEIVYFFRKIEQASEFINSNEYDENITCVWTDAIKEEYKKDFIEEKLNPLGLTMLDEEYNFEYFGIEQSYSILKRA